MNKRIHERIAKVCVANDCDCDEVEDYDEEAEDEFE